MWAWTGKKNLTHLLCRGGMHACVGGDRGHDSTYVMEEVNDGDHVPHKPQPLRYDKHLYKHAYIHVLIHAFVVSSFYHDTLLLLLRRGHAVVPGTALCTWMYVSHVVTSVLHCCCCA